MFSFLPFGALKPKEGFFIFIFFHAYLQTFAPKPFWWKSATLKKIFRLFHCFSLPWSASIALYRFWSAMNSARVYPVPSAVHLDAAPSQLVGSDIAYSRFRFGQQLADTEGTKTKKCNGFVQLRIFIFFKSSFF